MIKPAAETLVEWPAYREAVRFVMFHTNVQEYPYATNGGTAFLIQFRRRIFAITCQHVVQGFHVKDLIITDRRDGTKSAASCGIAAPSSRSGAAQGSDINDLCLVSFRQDCDANFFDNSAFALNKNTWKSSEPARQLAAVGFLKDNSKIVEPGIYAGFCVMQFTDSGTYGPDPMLRQGLATYLDPNFDRITGMSGAPVFNRDNGCYAGMLVRGGLSGQNCRVLFIDAAHIYRFIKAVYSNNSSLSYSFLPGL
jgi:hypothetical protein